MRAGTVSGIKVSSDKELMEVGRGGEVNCEWSDQIRGCGDFL